MHETDLHLEPNEASDLTIINVPNPGWDRTMLTVLDEANAEDALALLVHKEGLPLDEGWEAMRHYEIAAAAAVPCFRGLADKPPLCAPHGLRDGVNCVAYTDAGALLARLDSMPDEEYARLQSGALDWARANTTRARAEQFLSGLNVRA